VSGSLLGTASFTVIYLFPYPSDVRAIAYPNSIYPGFDLTSPCPGPAVPGARVAIGTWEWNDTHGNRVPGFDHSSTGVLNRVTIWPNFGLGLTFDGSVTLLGVTEGQGSCSGSGSNAVAEGMEELACAETLLVTVRGGPLQGRHLARRGPSRTWAADLGKARLEVSAERPDRLLIRVGSRVVESTRIEFSPLTAVFPAEAFDADDVVVTAR
jgi:hypothetical protein